MSFFFVGCFNEPDYYYLYGYIYIYVWFSLVATLSCHSKRIYILLLYTQYIYYYRKYIYIHYTYYGVWALYAIWVVRGLSGLLFPSVSFQTSSATCMGTENEYKRNLMKRLFAIMTAFTACLPLYLYSKYGSCSDINIYNIYLLVNMELYLHINQSTNTLSLLSPHTRAVQVFDFVFLVWPAPANDIRKRARDLYIQTHRTWLQRIDANLSQ